MFWLRIKTIIVWYALFMVLLVLTRLLITVKTQLPNQIHVYFSFIYFVVFSILLKASLKQTLLFTQIKSTHIVVKLTNKYFVIKFSLYLDRPLIKNHCSYLDIIVSFTPTTPWSSITHSNAKPRQTIRETINNEST